MIEKLTPDPNHCVDKAGHNFVSVLVKSLTELKPETQFTQNELQIFCTRCGATRRINETPLEYRNV